MVSRFNESIRDKLDKDQVASLITLQSSHKRWT